MNSYYYPSSVLRPPTKASILKPLNQSVNLFGRTNRSAVLFKINRSNDLSTFQCEVIPGASHICLFCSHPPIVIDCSGHRHDFFCLAAARSQPDIPWPKEAESNSDSGSPPSCSRMTLKSLSLAFGMYSFPSEENVSERERTIPNGEMVNVSGKTNSSPFPSILKSGSMIHWHAIECTRLVTS